jgi:di/tricarboxylate transporter
MTVPIGITCTVIVATFVAIASGKMRPELAALAACSILLLSGVLTPAEVFPLFGSEALVTVGAMFVLSAALEQTGVIDAASRVLQALPGKTERAVLLLVLPPVLAISAFVNNTPVVIVFLPILITLARKRNLAASKLLMPLSFTSILGGSLTLIGTSTNLVASSAGQRLGLQPIGMFELAPVALVLAAVGLGFLFIFAPRLLPRRETATSILEETAERRFITEAFISEGSPLIGRTARDAIAGPLRQGRLLELIRHGEAQGGQPGKLPLEAGDLLRISLPTSAVTALHDQAGVEVDPTASGLAMGRREEARIVECVVTPLSKLIGHTLAEANLARRFGARALALHRRGLNVGPKREETLLDTGDVLLMEVDNDALARVQKSTDLLLLAGGRRAFRLNRRALAVGIGVAVVIVGALQIVPVTVAALIGAVVVVAAGCVDPEEAYRAIDWPCLFLIAGMLALGAALEKTGAAALLAGSLVHVVMPMGPWFTLSLVILITSVLTNFLSNNAVAALLVPLAVQSAHVMGTNPRAFLVAVTLGASACFATPIGYQTNTLVFTSGGYRFSDFLRLGLPLNLLHWIIASFLIPLFWPL